MSHKKLVLDKEKILAQVDCLQDIARKHLWKYEYDDILDELIFGKEIMPRDSFIFNVNSEINLFLSPDSSVNGIHIEYFRSNFLEHNTELKPVLDAITSNKKTEKDINAELALEKEFVADTFKSLFNKDELVAAI